MTISSTTRRAGPFATNGVQTTFPFSFKVFAEEDLRVVSSEEGLETDLALTTDYTVALNADQDASPGGTVTLNTAPNGPTINILSAMEIEQPVVITNRGGFFPRVFNDVFDRLTIYAQQLEEKLNRSWLFPVGEAGFTLASASSRANTVLAFDENGNPTALTLGDASIVLQAQQREVTATEGQQAFAFLSDALPGFVSVYLNGVRLSETDFTHNTAIVTLAEPAQAGDIVVIEGFVNSTVDTSTALETNLRSPAGSAAVGFIQSGTGAVARTVQDKAREIVSVKDFGAVGDGATDDTAAIHAALAAHDEVFVPAGTYGVSATVTIPSGKTLRGAGRDKTFITPLDGFGPLPASNGGISCALTATGVRIADLTWHGNEQNLDVAGPNGTTNSALRIHGICPKGTNFIVERCGSNGVYYAFYATGSALYPASGVFRDCVSTNFSVAFEANEANGVLWDNCVAFDGDATMGLEAVLHALANSQNITYRKCRYRGGAGSGVNVQSNTAAQAGLVFDDCEIELIGDSVPFSVVGTFGSDVTVRGGYYKKPDAGAPALNISGASTVQISGDALFQGGAVGVYSDGGTVIANGARVDAGTNPAGTDAATGLTGTGGGSITWGGVGRITATGPGGGLTNASAGTVTIGREVISDPVIPGAQELVHGPLRVTAAAIQTDGTNSYAVVNLPFDIVNWANVVCHVDLKRPTKDDVYGTTPFTITTEPGLGANSIIVLFGGAVLTASGMVVNATVTEFA